MKLLLVALAVLLASSHPARSQDVVDVWALGDLSACEAQSSGAGFGNCVSVLRDSVDAELNRVYREAMVWARRSAAKDPHRRDLPAVLRRAQRGWVQLKEAECGGALVLLTAPGNGGGATMAQCEIAKSRIRIAELRQYYHAGPWSD